MIAKIIKAFDLYGNYFQLRINNQTKYKSIIGGLLSMLTLGILVFCFISFGQDFYERKNPKVTVEEGLYKDEELPLINGTQYKNKTVILCSEGSRERNEIIYDYIQR